MIPMIPVDPEDITAEGLAAHNVRLACLLACKVEDLIAEDSDKARIGDLTNAMLGRTAIAYLLREIHPAVEADDLARRLWEMLCDGSEVEEFLAICADEYGLDDAA